MTHISDIKVLAFLQNQWFKEPTKIKAMYDKHAGADLAKRAKLNHIFLFLKSHTGRRLRSAFGDLCEHITWEEANPGMVDKSSGLLPPDPEHIQKIINFWQPQIILAFGKPAKSGVEQALAGNTANGVLICGPHPAARLPSISAELGGMACRVRRFYNFADNTGRPEIGQKETSEA